MTSVIASRTNVSLSRYVYKASRVEIDIKLTSKKLIALRNVSYSLPKAKQILGCSRIYFHRGISRRSD